MRAAVVWSAGDPFDVTDVTRRRPGPTEVVVRLGAAGICQTDLTLAGGGFGQHFPAVLGHEGAGEVVETGVAVTNVSVGDRVVITWAPACGHCYHCVRGETYICANRKRAADLDPDAADLRHGDVGVQAAMGTATFAEETVLPWNAVIPIPEDLPYEYAAMLGCAVPTGVGAALNAGRVSPGETVLVVGCGAVGLSAVQGARIGGATTIVAIDPQESRRELALELGATEAYEPGDPSAGSAVAGVGFDVGIDAVGRSTTIRSTWDAVRRGGRVIVVGAGKADDLVTFSASELFHDEKELRGTFYGSSNMVRDLPQLIAFWRAGLLRLDRMVEGTVPLEEINDAVERQRAGEALRVMVSL